MADPIAHQVPMLGATVLSEGVRFEVWAPKANRVEVALETPSGARYIPLDRHEDGLHAGIVLEIGPGARYHYRLDGEASYPDPYSRFQPEGVHGPSEVVDPNAFVWTDDDWLGIGRDGLVIYEVHVGTYTPDGTFAALTEELPELERLGVTAIELMPIAEFPGERNWGYDGVDLFAPCHVYGKPDDLCRLVDAAHRLGLAVILDVVYNHLGPDGNYLRAFSDDYFTDRHTTPWGEAINYDGPNARRVRDFVIANACYWVREFHVDGFRLDATDQIKDDSPVHILSELTAAARAATHRSIVVIAEDAENNLRLVHPPERGGYGLDAAWADDFHHELRVFLTGAREHYFGNYPGSLERVAKAIEEGHIYQGEPTRTTGRPKGSRVTDEPATAFVFCIQNHDQVGNRPFGERLHHEIDSGRYAVASTVLLFAPETPLLFMGQEFAASTPFLYFTDHTEELGRLVTAGRREEFSGFRAFSDPDLREAIPDPQALSTFLASKLRLEERRTNAALYRLYRELLALRRGDPELAVADRGQTRACAVGAHLLIVHRWAGDEHRLLLANFGAATSLSLADTPLFESSPRDGWRVMLSTSARRYGGTGERPRFQGRGVDRAIALPARSAAILAGGGAVTRPSLTRSRKRIGGAVKTPPR